MTQLLQNAAYGTALILAAAFLRRVLKDRLVPGARLALWAVCLFRLLTPAAPQSVLSLWGLFASLAPGSQPSSPAYSTMSYLPPTTGAFVPQIVEPGTSPDLYLKPAPFPWEKVLPAVWLIVGIALAVRYVRNWMRTRRAVACAIPVERSDPRYTSLPRCARLREGPMEGAPLTFGAVKPTVVLSPGLEGEALDCVLAHEGVHASRRDNLWHYVMAIALIIHWWDPAVWLMARLLRRDIELSCDRAALKKLGEDRRAEYANTLVSLATQGDGPAFCQTFGRKAAEERVLSVMKFKKTSVIGVILSLTLVLAVTAAFASEPKAPADTVEYHGQTYNRADLSQETLDWLDWYLALPEEQQLAISMVPPELIPGLAPDGYDDMPAAVPDQPVYAAPDGAIDPSLKEALEAARRDRFEAAVKDALDEDKTVSDYDVNLPTFDEDGSPVSSDGSIAGEQLHSYDSINDSVSAVGADPVPVPSAEPATYADPSVQTVGSGQGQRNGNGYSHHGSNGHHGNGHH